MLENRGVLIALAVLVSAIAVVRVVTTYRVFNQTADEPVHIAAGFEWLSTDGYKLDLEHPPLARVLFALPAFLEGTEVARDVERLHQGNQILHANDRYLRNLAWARTGNLLFLALGIGVVAVWAWRLFGGVAGVVAAALFGSLPPVLAYAGLATTDMAAAATTAAAAYCVARFLKNPSWWNTIALGFFVALGLVSKFSFPVFFGTSVLVAVVARLSFRRNQESSASVRLSVRQAAIVVLIAVIGVWVGYKFEFGTVIEKRLVIPLAASPEYTAASYSRVPGYEWVRPDIIERYWSYGKRVKDLGWYWIDFVDWAKAAGYPSPLAGRSGDTISGAPAVTLRPVDELLEPVRATWQWVAVRVPVPAPAFFAGLTLVTIHNRMGHPTFLLGKHAWRGWWYYFPVVFFFKTPVAFLALSIAGVILLMNAAWHRHDPEAISIAISPVLMMVVVLPSSINIGVRHLLPLYPWLSIAAAFAAVTVWRLTERALLARCTVVVLLLWHFVGTAVAHPDYLAYFNEMAGPHPEKIAVDSNLDWGQDLLRLADAIRKEKIESIRVAYFGTADIERHLGRVEALDPETCSPGWAAISEMEFQFRDTKTGAERFVWLKQFRPVRRIGKSIWLYHIPVGACPQASIE